MRFEILYIVPHFESISLGGTRLFSINIHFYHPHLSVRL